MTELESRRGKEAMRAAIGGIASDLASLELRAARVIGLAGANGVVRFPWRGETMRWDGRERRQAEAPGECADCSANRRL